ncbi:MAG TPA: serine hydrolase domain-containing protein, partial [Xanthomonadaceae bacterium]|nr:serine hydrolase domain-containing protein [Xanthomonadaceae bacterium]
MRDNRGSSTPETQMSFRLLCLTLSFLCSSAAFAQDACLQQAIAREPLQDEALHGQVVISTLVQGRHDTRVFGDAAAAPPLEGDEGFRIASITKPYVAATVFRLAEADRIDLDAPITRWLPQAWMQQLESDGYEPGRITVRHLLSHTSGLADHAQTQQFLQAIIRDPQSEWTRARDIARLVEWADPVGTPGEKFVYSDTGYVLLGEIVEEVTGQDLPDAVRTQLDFDKLGLRRTWWERYEDPGDRPRAHQVFQGADTYTWNPSMDLYGGGGLVASAADVATFFDALLDGRVFRKPETLAQMLSREGVPEDSP